MKPSVEHIAIDTGGGVTILQFVTHQPRSGAGPGWSREATDDAIRSEIKRAGIDAYEWCRIDPNTLPDRSTRRAWKLVDKRVVVSAEKLAEVPSQEEQTEAVDLPRFLQTPAQPAIAPEMLAREAEFTQRATEVVEAARQSIEASRSDNSRITALEQQVTKIQDILVNLAERWGKQ